MPSMNPIASIRRAFQSSPWLVMSVLFHVILLTALGLVAIRHQREEERTAEAIAIVHHFEEPPPPPIAAPEEIDRTQIPPDQQVEIVDPDTMMVEFDPTIVPEDLSLPIGDPESTDLLASPPPAGSTSIGVGIGPGHRGPGPSTGSGPFDRRRNEGTEGLPPGRKPTGQQKVIDKAVREGLLWLCRHQNPDGSWGARTLRDRCDPGAPCSDPAIEATDRYDEGLTGLALLAFLGAGFDHRSHADLNDDLRAERHRLGEVVAKGLSWLRDRQNPDGSFSRGRAFLYNEALATMVLCEAYGMSEARIWRDPARRGVEFLQRAQRPGPTGDGLWGWRYASREDVEAFRGGTGDEAYARELHDADTSVTTWCVMALKSAQLSGFAVDPRAMQGALAFCDFVTPADAERSGLAGYLDARGAGSIVTGPFGDRFTYHPTTMSALAMCIRIFARHDAGDPFLEEAAKRLVADLPRVSEDGASIDYYYWYYASLALNQFDGPDSPRSGSRYWRPWNEAMVRALLGLQVDRQGSCARGGWTRNDRWASASGAGALYDTALNVLTLEVYYRYPNAFGAR